MPAAAPPRLLGAGLCAVCRGWCQGGLCEACLGRYAAPRPRCPRCGLGVPDGVFACMACVHEPPPYQHTVAAVDYGFPWDRLIQRFKYQAQVELAGVLAARLLAALQHHGAAAPDAVLPVPLSPARQRERGYNQAWELARRVARGLRLGAHPHLLRRLQDGAHQAELGRAQRLAHLRHAFMVPPALAAQVKGRHLALVDDVLTTGATAACATRALLEAGAGQVSLWVLARTPAPQDG